MFSLKYCFDFFENAGDDDSMRKKSWQLFVVIFSIHKNSNNNNEDLEGLNSCNHCTPHFWEEGVCLEIRFDSLYSILCILIEREKTRSGLKEWKKKGDGRS